MQKKSGLQALIATKCPRCRKGDMFIYPFYHPFRFDKMYPNCPHCHLRYEVEPGFFIGAMYISYAMTVTVLAIAGLILFLGLKDPGLWVYIIVFPVTVILLLPLIFRYSRAIFLYAFGGVRFDEKL